MSKQDEQQANAARMRQDIEGLGALPLPRLAAVIMAAGFGPDGPGGPGKPGTLEDQSLTLARLDETDIAPRLSPCYAARGVPPYANWYLTQLIGEGLQVLQNAGLVRMKIAGDFPDYKATRLGRAALQRDAVEHVIAGGAL